MVIIRKQRIKDLQLRARVVVKTSNMKISRRRLADCVKKLQQKACRTCRTIIFPHSTNQCKLLVCSVDVAVCRRHFLNSAWEIFTSTEAARVVPESVTDDERGREVKESKVTFSKDFSSFISIYIMINFCLFVNFGRLTSRSV